MQVFIAWSSERTLRLADALASLLGDVVEGLDVFVSSRIGKGVAWPPEIRRALRDSGVGIICLAWEHRDSPWLAFEAGALAGTLQFGEGRLHPYLLGLDVRHVPDPLQQFQATGTTRAETRAMVASIAGQHGDRGPWSNRFEAAWPPLAQVLEELRWMDLEEAVPRFFEGFDRNTFLTEMPTGTPERLHRYVVADHLSERLLASRLVVESHCAPEVDRHFGRVVNALVEFRDNTGALMVDRGGWKPDGSDRGLASRDPGARGRPEVFGPGVRDGDRTMAARLFISHSFADGRRAAECLVTGLTDRSRACAVWSPTRGIRSGHSWIQQVTQAFQGSAPASW